MLPEFGQNLVSRKCEPREETEEAEFVFEQLYHNNPEGRLNAARRLANNHNLTWIAEKLARRGGQNDAMVVEFLIKHEFAVVTAQVYRGVVAHNSCALLRWLLYRESTAGVAATEKSDVDNVLFFGLCGSIETSNVIAFIRPDLLTESWSSRGTPPCCSRAALAGIADGCRCFQPPRWLFET